MRVAVGLEAFSSYHLPLFLNQETSDHTSAERVKCQSWTDWNYFNSTYNPDIFFTNVVSLYFAAILELAKWMEIPYNLAFLNPLNYTY